MYSVLLFAKAKTMFPEARLLPTTYKPYHAILVTETDKRNRRTETNRERGKEAATAVVSIYFCWCWLLSNADYHPEEEDDEKCCLNPAGDN